MIALIPGRHECPQPDAEVTAAREGRKVEHDTISPEHRQENEKAFRAACTSLSSRFPEESANGYRKGGGCSIALRPYCVAGVRQKAVPGACTGDQVQGLQDSMHGCVKARDS